MKLTRRTAIAGMVAIGVLLVAGVAVRLAKAPSLAEQRAGTYYCPMHPTYTSNRPGDCPICNMRLVKREPKSVTQPSPSMAGHDHEDHEQSSAEFQSICYLHNCPKLHEGQPCPMTVVAKPGEAVTCPICGTHIAEAAPTTRMRKVLYWTDPMIPGYKADGPGKSPMGMDLVPVYEEDVPSAASGPTAGYAPVLLTPVKQQLIGVRAAPALRQRVTKTIRTVGTIAHDPELYQAQAEFIQASQALQQAQTSGHAEVTAQAERLLESSRLRLRHLGLGDDTIEEIRTWTAPDRRLLIGGTGEHWVYASIYEYELSLVHPGDRATVEVEAFPGRTFAGLVRSVDPMLDPMTRTARARILVEDLEGILKPAMFATVTLTADLGERLTVPVEAVFVTGERYIVFVDKGQGLFEPRDVVVGAKANDVYEVLSGVAEGEPVVTSGNFLIDSESRLKAALEGLGSGGHQHGQ